MSAETKESHGEETVAEEQKKNVDYEKLDVIIIKKVYLWQINWVKSYDSPSLRQKSRSLGNLIKSI